MDNFMKAELEKEVERSGKSLMEMLVFNPPGFVEWAEAQDVSESSRYAPSGLLTWKTLAEENPDVLGSFITYDSLNPSGGAPYGRQEETKSSY